MSTLSQQIASGNGNSGDEKSPSSTRRKKSPYKAAMATKVKWALNDSLQRTQDARVRMRLIVDWVEELRKINSLDMRVLAHLGKLDHQVAILALDIADVERILERAVSESKEMGT